MKRHQSKHARKAAIQSVSKLDANRNALVDQIAGEIPTTWLDSLLSGNEKVMGPPPWGCQDIEALLNAIRARILAFKNTQSNAATQTTSKG